MKILVLLLVVTLIVSSIAKIQREGTMMAGREDAQKILAVSLLLIVSLAVL